LLYGVTYVNAAGCRVAYFDTNDRGMASDAASSLALHLGLVYRSVAIELRGRLADHYGPRGWHVVDGLVAAGEGRA
jgi:hypothetical protein